MFKLILESKYEVLFHNYRIIQKCMLYLNNVTFYKYKSLLYCENYLNSIYLYKPTVQFIKETVMVF